MAERRPLIKANLPCQDDIEDDNNFGDDDNKANLFRQDDNEHDYNFGVNDDDNHEDNDEDC